MRTLSVFFIIFLSANFAYAEDQEIVDLITSKVSQSIPLSRYKLTVESRNGHVTLSGPVASEEEIKEITDIAATTTGVLSVKDRMTINTAFKAGMDRDSQLLCMRVKNNIIGQNRALNIECQGGDVTITGIVSDEAASKRIEQAAWNTSGVKSVRTAVSFPKPLTDGQITEAVQMALQREGKGTRTVSFASKNGIVYFSGTVPNHRIIDAMLSTALMVEGVKDVESTVTIAR